MMKYAVVQEGIVENLVVWDGNTETWLPPEGATAVLVPDGTMVSIGYAYDGTEFSAQAPL